MLKLCLLKKEKNSNGKELENEEREKNKPSR